MFVFLDVNSKYNNYLEHQLYSTTIKILTITPTTQGKGIAISPITIYPTMDNTK
jgi:hypothetical protein